MKKYSILLLMLCMITIQGCKKEDRTIWVVSHSYPPSAPLPPWMQGDTEYEAKRNATSFFKNIGIQIFEIKSAEEWYGEPLLYSVIRIYCRIYKEDMDVMQQYGFKLAHDD